MKAEGGQVKILGSTSFAGKYPHKLRPRGGRKLSREWTEGGRPGGRQIPSCDASLLLRLSDCISPRPSRTCVLQKRCTRPDSTSILLFVPGPGPPDRRGFRPQRLSPPSIDPSPARFQDQAMQSCRERVPNSTHHHDIALLDELLLRTIQWQHGLAAARWMPTTDAVAAGYAYFLSRSPDILLSKGI